MGGIAAGLRDRKIVVQRATAVTDDYGGEAPTWSDYAIAWARVRFGTAREKREAAQESGAQTATFECDSNSVLRGVTILDRIIFDGSDWDISEAAPLDRQTIRFTAARSR